MLANRMMSAGGTSVGQQLYDTAGTFSFVVPIGVTQVSVCCIGGGGGARAHSSAVQTLAQSRGAGGGALSYVNSITVIPGNSYTVVVGAGGSGTADGGNSTFNSTDVVANGGQSGFNGGAGGTVGVGTGGAGGAGGTANQGYTASYGTALYGGGGGGGAGGYSGAGGAGGNNQSNGTTTSGTAGAAGTGGAAGGGGGGAGLFDTTTDYQAYATTAGGNGGGTGIKGTGTSGASASGAVYNGSAAVEGKGGSSGTDGASPYGGSYGGGAGSYYEGYQWDPQGDPGGSIIAVFNYASVGGVGAVRILWGGGRSYPSNAADV